MAPVTLTLASTLQGVLGQQTGEEQQKNTTLRCCGGGGGGSASCSKDAGVLSSYLEREVDATRHDSVLAPERVTGTPVA